MNRIYKTVWNAVRGQTVAINEKMSGQGRGSALVDDSPAASRHAALRLTTAGLMLGGLLCTSAHAALGIIVTDGDMTYSQADLEVGKVAVSAGASATIATGNGRESNVTVTGDFENAGTITGELANWTSAYMTNAAGANFSAKSFTLLSGSDDQTLSNAGTFTVNQFTSSGNVDNTGAFNVTGNAEISSFFKNAGSLSGGDFALKNGANLAFENGNAELASLTLEAGSRVSGTSKVFKVTGETLVKQGAAVSVTNLATGSLNNDSASFEVDNLNVAQSASFTTNSSATLGNGTVQGDLSNNGTLNFNTLTVKGTLTNYGTLDVRRDILPDTKQWLHAKNIVNYGSIYLSTPVSFENLTNYASEMRIQSQERITFNSLTVHEGSVWLNDVSGNNVENSGTIMAGTLLETKSLTNNQNAVIQGMSLNVTEKLSNEGTLQLDATATIAGHSAVVNGTVSSGALMTLGVDELSGSANYSAGSLLVSRGSASTQGTFSVTNDALIDQGASLAVKGGATFNANVTLSGALLVGADSTIASLSMNRGATLTNEGSLTINTANALDDVTYNHNGTGTLTIQNGAWFTNSTLNLNGGAWTLSSLGSNNTYNLRSDAALTANDWTTNRTKLTVDTLTSENTVNLLQGGVLEVKTLALTSGNKTLTLNGGALVTSLNQIFDGLKTEAIKLEGENEGSIVDINGYANVATSVGDVRDGVKQNVNFVSGDLVFDDAVISSSLVTAVNDKFSAGIANAQNVTLHYTGRYSDDFTVSVGNEILGDANSGAQVGVIFDNTDLKVTDGHVLVVGNDEAVLEGLAERNTEQLRPGNAPGIGFAAVTGTNEIVVSDGKNFALIGSDGDYKALLGTDGNVDETSVTVTGTGSILTLGSVSRTAAKGRLGTIKLDNKASLENDMGSYRVKAIRANNGNAYIRDGELQTESLSLLSSSTLVVDKGTFIVAAWEDDSSARITNRSLFRATNDMSLRGNYVNEGSGQAHFDGTLTLADNGRFQNTERTTSLSAAGLAIGQFATFDNKGAVSVTGDASISGLYANYEGAQSEFKGTLILNTMGTFEAAGGTTSVERLVMQDGDVNVTGGNFEVTGGVDFNAGKFVVDGSHAVTRSPLTVTLELTNAIGGTLAVDTGVVHIGQPSELGTQRLAEMPSAAHTLVADNGQLFIGETGKIAVGSGAKTRASELAAGDAWFGNDSMFVMDTSKLTPIDASSHRGTAALVGNGSGTLSVDAGATLYVQNIGWGSYYVTNAFHETDLNAEGWEKHLMFAPTADVAEYTLKTDDAGNVILTVTKKGDDVDGGGNEGGITAFPDVAIPDNVQEIINNAPNRTYDDDAIGFINKAVDNGYLDSGLMVDTINQVAEIGAVGGVLAQNMTLAGNVTDLAERHLTFEDAHFARGELRRWEGVRLWADAIGQKTAYDALPYKMGEATMDADNYGFIMGGDFLGANEIRYGIAAAYQKGSLKAKNTVVSTSNDTDAYSVTAYAAKTFGNFNVLATVGYNRLESRVTQVLPASMQQSNHELDQADDVITASVKGEYRIPLSKGVDVTPYLGLRHVTTLANDVTSTFAGKAAFNYGTDALQQFQVPVGVKLTGEATQDGWTSRGVIDLSVIPVFGDRDAATTVNIESLKAVDTIYTTFSDSFQGNVRAGFSMEKDGLRVGGNLGVTGLGAMSTSISLGVDVRYAF